MLPFYGLYGTLYLYQALVKKLFRGILSEPDKVLADIDAALVGIRGYGLTAAEKSEFWQIINLYESQE